MKVRIKRLPQARTGYQVQGSLRNDVPAMGGADYNAYIGQPKLKGSKYITKVPRDEANLEAEGGETVFGDINGDGMPEHKIIKGPRHAQGGVPLSLPDDTFIFSDFNGMKLKDPNLLGMFGKGGASKGFTPAELAKQYDIEKYRKILQDPESDTIDRKTAELMLKNYTLKLGALALAQESKKGFPQGIPAVARPYMEANNIKEEDILPNEVNALNKQIDEQFKQNEASAETEASPTEEQDMMSGVDQAQEMNQGQPVAQPSQEEMMRYGGFRRLRRAQEGMQQQGGGDQMQQMMQQIGQALEQGAQPEDVIAQLLQSQVPPQAIMQIFVQLGMPEEQVGSAIQSVMAELQGGQEEMAEGPQGQNPQEEMMEAPMAQYGMTMGGYDMPFYDMPEAEYGMSMGANPQNYQGRKKNMYGSGPMFYRNGGDLPKAKDGIIIDGSKMTDDELQEAIFNAEQAGEKNIKVKGKDGKTRIFKGKTNVAAAWDDKNDLVGFPDSTAGKTAAAQYYLIKKNLDNSSVSSEITKSVKELINNPSSWQGKSQASADPNETWTKKFGAPPTDKEIYDAALKHQKRNLLFQANEIDPQLFTDNGNSVDKAADIVNKFKYNNPETGKTYTLDEANKALLKIKGFGNNVAEVSEKMGLPLDPKGRDRVLQQATMHGYAQVHKKYKAGEYKGKPEQYAMSVFLDGIPDVKSGANDETTMGALYGPVGNNISPLDDEYDYDNTNWYHPDPKTTSGLKTGKYSKYGDSTAGHLYAVKSTQLNFEDIPEGCQCTDPTNKETYKAPDAEGNCPCDLPKDKPEPCDCEKSDGTKIDTGRDPNTGDCLPCEEEIGVDVAKPPASWWLQDTIKTVGAAGDLMGLKKYLPWAPKADLETPRPTFMDPTRELGANAEQANIQTQGAAQFAGPQGLSARSASIQGQASKNAADVLSKYNNANVNIANQFEFKANDVRNQEQMLNQAANTKMYDQNTIANQQFDNAKLAMRGQLRNQYTNAITNRWKTDALNQMYPQYQVDPSTGGRMYYTEGKDFKPEQTSGMTWEEAYKWCKDEGEKNPSECATRKMNASGGSTTQNENKANMIKTIYKKKGGDTNGGFVYADMMYPFIL